MTCPRCKTGPMEFKNFDTLNDDRYYGWRCVMCGEGIDPVIIQNRLKSRSSSLSSPGGMVPGDVFEPMGEDQFDLEEWEDAEECQECFT
jgi:hypothetical protein